MSQTPEQHLLDRLETHKDNLTARTLFTVNYLNEYGDRFPSLPRRMQKTIFDAFTDNASFYTKKHELSCSLESKEIIYPKTSLDNFANAYEKIASEFDFSCNFIKGIFTHIKKTIAHTPYQGNWQESSLDDKIKYLDKLARDFLKLYDPRNIIHDNDQFGYEDIVDSATCPYIKQDGHPAAFLDTPDSKINFIRYFTVYNKNSSINYKKSDALFDAFDLDSAVFDHDRSYDRNRHVQYNSDTDNIRLISLLGNENDSKSLLAHEMFHLLLFRLRALHQSSPNKAKRYFHFNETNYRLAAASAVNNIGFDNVTTYYTNREEVFAHAIGEVTLEYLEAKPKPATGVSNPTP